MGVKAGIYITMLNGRIFFLTNNEYQENDEYFEADTKNVIEVVYQQQNNKISVGFQKLSELPPMSTKIKIIKSTISFVEVLDINNEMCKKIYEAKSGLILPPKGTIMG